MRLLTKSIYRDLCVLIGEKLEGQCGRIQRVGQVTGFSVGIYVLGHQHPVTDRFVADYVGSAIRPCGDISDRIREHLRDAHKSVRFTCQVVLPLRDDLNDKEVRRLEGQIARALGVPPWCARIPGGRRTPA